MKIATFVAFALVLICLAGFPVEAGPPGPPVTQVEVTNFPDPQDVSVTNFPDPQNVSVTNLPDVLDVNMVNSDRVRVEVSATLFVGESGVGLIFVPSSDNPLVPLPRVPVGMKLVLTDFVINHNIVGKEGVFGANIRMAGANTTCEDGPVGLKVQFRVGPGQGVAVGLSTGFEYLSGQAVCLATGGTTSIPNLGLSYKLFGYLTDATAN